MEDPVNQTVRDLRKCSAPQREAKRSFLGWIPQEGEIEVMNEEAQGGVRLLQFAKKRFSSRMPTYRQNTRKAHGTFFWSHCQARGRDARAPAEMCDVVPPMLPLSPKRMETNRISKPSNFISQCRNTDSAQGVRTIENPRTIEDDDNLQLAAYREVYARLIERQIEAPPAKSIVSR